MTHFRGLGRIQKIISFGFWFKWEQENLPLKFTDLYELRLKGFSVLFILLSVSPCNFLILSFSFVFQSFWPHYLLFNDFFFSFFTFSSSSEMARGILPREGTIQARVGLASPLDAEKKDDYYVCTLISWRISRIRQTTPLICAVRRDSFAARF